MIRHYKHKRERNLQKAEEKARWHDDRFNPHWGCPFFTYCWEEGLRLPSMEDCPECNSRSYRRDSAFHRLGKRVQREDHDQKRDRRQSREKERTRPRDPKDEEK